jgi:hypothetical protein
MNSPRTTQEAAVAAEDRFEIVTLAKPLGLNDQNPA